MRLEPARRRGRRMEPALFSPSSLFRCSDEDDDSDERVGGGGVPGAREQQDEDTTFVERVHPFPAGTELAIREFSFHQHNANLLWPGTFAFSEWLLQNKACFQGKRILELGSGTGALAIYLRKMFAVDITTSDFDDPDIEKNIAHNCAANGLDVLPHIRHTWGDPFPVVTPDWDVILASDILLYVKQYSNLVKTLRFLLRSADPGFIAPSDKRVTFTHQGKEVHLQYPVFLMSWRRRLGKEDEALFFDACRDASFAVHHLGARVYCTTPPRDSNFKF